MKKNRFLIVVHVYYTNQLDLISKCLENIPSDYDLYITSDEKNQNLIAGKISNVKPDFHFVSVPNIGYDVWPFVKVINDLDLDKYQYVIKLHTKRDMTQKDTDPYFFVIIGNGFYLDHGSVWRDSLFEFIKTKENLNKCLEALNQKDVGMCTRFDMIHGMKYHDSVINYAKETYPKYVFGLDDFSFVAGTMFISKIEPIKLIKNLNISENLFEKSSETHKTQFAHVVERTLGEAVYKLNMKIIDPFTSKKYIKKINARYKKLHWIHRIINYITFVIPFAKVRRKSRDYLTRLFYFPYLRYIIKTK